MWVIDSSAGFRLPTSCVERLAGTAEAEVEAATFADARLHRRFAGLLRLLWRDVGRKTAGDAAAEAAFAGPLALVARLLRRRREDRGGNKLYSLHAPEV